MHLIANVQPITYTWKSVTLCVTLEDPNLGAFSEHHHLSSTFQYGDVF